MGVCSSTESATAAAVSREIDKQLKMEHKATEQTIKLLLLGAGETGKSTVLKQIRLIHGSGYTDKERMSYKIAILTNILTCAKTLVGAMESLKIPWGFDASNISVDILQQLAIADGLLQQPLLHHQQPQLRDNRSETGSGVEEDDDGANPPGNAAGLPAESGGHSVVGTGGQSAIPASVKKLQRNSNIIHNQGVAHNPLSYSAAQLLGSHIGSMTTSTTGAGTFSDAVEGQSQAKIDPIARVAAHIFQTQVLEGIQIPSAIAEASAIISASPMGFGVADPIPQRLVDAIKLIWSDSGVQYCYKRSNEYQLIDCCGVFLNDLTRLCNPDFLPSDQDILNCRVMTTTISETLFKIEGITFRVFDVGGQRSERKKWAPYFDDINAIIYLVAINSYDQICFEDDSTNRMVESMNLFASICNHPMFKKTAMIIFMNKIDLFRAKLETTLIRDYFPTYEGPNDYENGSEYFATRFLSLNKYEKKIYVHFTWATDTKQIKTVLAIVNQIILRSNLVEAGL